MRQKLRLTTGKRYVRRDGRVTGALTFLPDDFAFHWFDPLFVATYRDDGTWSNDERDESPFDLIAEYRPPVPAHTSGDYDQLGELQREYNARQSVYDVWVDKERDEKEEACWRALREPGASDVVGPEFWNDYFKGHDTKDTNPKDSIGCTKPPLHTVPTGPLFEAGAVLLHGHCKYRGYNWRVAGVRSSIYYDAVMRHMMAWWEGEDTDPDSGLPHIAHAISGLCVLRDSQMAGNCTDDRPPRRSHPFNGLRSLVSEMAQKPQPEPYTESNTQ